MQQLYIVIAIYNSYVDLVKKTQSEGLHSIKNTIARCTLLTFSGNNYLGYYTVFFFFSWV